MRKLLIYSLAFLFVLSISYAIAEKKSESESKEDDPKKTEAVDTTEIRWVRYDEGVERAENEEKPILVNFTTSWCGYCKKMNRTTFKEPEVIKMLNGNFVSIKVDGDSREMLDIDGYKISERDLTIGEYRVRGYPSYWFLKPDGEKVGNLPGYQQADIFLEVLFFVKEGLYDKMSFEEYMKNGGRKEYSKG